MISLLLLAATISQPIVIDQHQERRIECATRANLVYYAVLAKAQGLARDRFHWTDELDETDSAEAARKAVGEVWEEEVGDATERAVRVFEGCMGDET